MIQRARKLNIYDYCLLEEYVPTLYVASWQRKKERTVSYSIEAKDIVFLPITCIYIIWAQKKEQTLYNIMMPSSGVLCYPTTLRYALVENMIKTTKPVTKQDVNSFCMKSSP